MKTKKTLPILTKSSNPKLAKSRRKIWIAFILALLFFAIGYLISKQSEPETTTAVRSAPAAVAQIEEPQTVPVEDVTIDNSAASDGNIEASDAQIPNPNTILDAPLPETDSLAKEEIDRLEDESKRLAEQEKLTAEQIIMTKKLTDMKAEQIELLEQQIAQLEADTDVKTGAK